MRHYDKKAVSAAFSTISRLSRENSPVVMVKIEGLNSVSRGILKEVLTHSFNYKTHGFTLDKIFHIDSKGIWHRQPTPNNPKDQTLIDLIIKAMTYVNVSKRNQRNNKSSEFKSNTEFTDHFLINELKSRGYMIFKVM